MKKLGFWIGLGIILLGMSCSSVKEAATKTKVSEREMLKSWNRLQSLAFPYESISYRSKIDIDAPGLKIQVKLNTHLIKDSLLWASVSKFGIESHRMLLTPDTIKILDRLANQYLVGSTNKWLEDQGLDLSFDELQRLWIGMHPKNPGVLAEPKLLSPNFQIFWHEQGLDIRYVFALPQNHLHNILIQDQAEQSLEVNQSEFKSHGNERIPYIRSYEVNGRENLKLDQVIQEVRVNTSKQLSFQVPRKYNLVTI